MIMNDDERLHADLHRLFHTAGWPSGTSNASNNPQAASTEQHRINNGPQIGSVQGSGPIHIATNQQVVNVSVYGQPPRSSFAPVDPAAIRTQFADLELDDNLRIPFRSEIIDSLRAAIINHRLLIVHVRPDTPGRWLLEETALAVREFRSSQMSNGTVPLTIRVYRPSDDDDEDNPTSILNAVEAEFHAQADPTILLIPSATRQHLGWDFESIYRLAAVHGHFVLAATTLPPKAWDCQPGERDHWREIQKDEALFRPAFLTAYLRQRLIERQTRLPRAIQQKTQANDILLGNDWTIAQTAERLKSPVNIDAWLQTVSHLHKGLDVVDLQKLVQEFVSQDLRHIMMRWYRDILDSKERLLALGLCLLDGLEESQILTALNGLKREIWEQLGASGSIIDHIDLLDLQTFFTIRKISTTEIRIESAISGQRQILLDLALEHHPMHLRVVIPWLAQVIKNSNDSKAARSLLYTTKAHRDQIRLAASTNLCDLCLLAPNLVDSALLQLVADRRYAVQVCLARILARWLLLDPNGRVPALLAYWRNDSNVQKDIRSLLHQDEAPTSKDDTPTTLVNGVVILTVSYVWRYAKPGDDIPELSQLLLSAVQDQSPRIRNYLQQYVLPLLPQYSIQLDPVLRLLVRDENFRPQIIDALVAAYRDTSREINNLLKRWFQDAKHDMAWYTPSPELSAAETLLVVVSETLSRIALHRSTPSVLGTVRSRLQSIRNEVRHPMACSIVWDNSFAISEKDIAALAALLRTVQEHDATMVQEKLQDLFEREYGILSPTLDGWIQGEQLTSVSTTLYGSVSERAVLALIDGSNTFSQEYSFWVLFTFARYVRRTWKTGNRSRSSKLPVQHLSAFYRDVLVPELITQGQPSEVREAVLHLLPQARNYYERYPEALGLTLERLKRESLTLHKCIATCLQEAIRLDTSEDWMNVVGSHRLQRAFVSTWQVKAMPYQIQLRVIGLILLAIMALLIAGVIVIKNGTIGSVLIVGLLIALLGRWLYRRFGQPITL